MVAPAFIGVALLHCVRSTSISSAAVDRVSARTCSCNASAAGDQVIHACMAAARCGSTIPDVRTQPTRSRLTTGDAGQFSPGIAG